MGQALVRFREKISDGGMMLSIDRPSPLSLQVQLLHSASIIPYHILSGTKLSLCYNPPHLLIQQIYTSFSLCCSIRFVDLCNDAMYIQPKRII